MRDEKALDQLAPEACAEIEELERLWAASPDFDHEPLSASPIRRLTAGISARLGTLLAVGWFAFFGAVSVAPAPDPEVATPVWAQALLAGIVLALGAGAIVGMLRSRRAGFALAAAAGALGVALAVGCMAIEHHPGSWWGFELGAMTALTGLAVLGVAMTGEGSGRSAAAGSGACPSAS